MKILWSHSEMFWKQNTAMFSSMFLLLRSLFWNLERNRCSENVQKLHQKRQKLQFFNNSCKFEAFSSTNWTYLVTNALKTTNLPMSKAFSHTIPRSLSIFRQKLNKNSENRKIIEILSFSMSIPDNFRLKNYIYFFSKHTGQHILSLLTLFNVSIDEVCQKFGKNV